jgi:hypothetical protein
VSKGPYYSGAKNMPRDILAPGGDILWSYFPK